jgi:hypothetical protein
VHIEPQRSHRDYVPPPRDRCAVVIPVTSSCVPKAELRFGGQVAIVTGTTSGLGRAS